MNYRAILDTNFSQRTVMLVTGLSVLFLGSFVASSDTLELRNGSLLKGTYTGGSQSTVQFDVNGSIQTHSRDDVVSIAFDAPAPPPPPPTPQASAASSAVVPAGSRILVRMVDNLDSRTHKTGHRFTMAVEADIVEKGQVLIPRGTIAYGRLLEAKQARRLRGKSELTLEVTEFMINNQLRPVLTQDIKSASDQASSGRKTLRRTAAGAAIGGLVDGSSGAKTGAAVGLGVSVLTKGDTISIPAGTLLEFRLAAPFQP